MVEMDGDTKVDDDNGAGCALDLQKMLLNQRVLSKKALDRRRWEVSILRARLVRRIFKILMELKSNSIPNRVWLADSRNLKSEFYSSLCLVGKRNG
ncbi:hypothetical protein Tco_0709215 [Tanacetum coccineum]